MLSILFGRKYYPFQGNGQKWPVSAQDKETDLSRYSQDDLNAIAWKLITRP